MIIDSHCHLHDEKYAADLDEVLIRAQQASITHMVSIGCDIRTTQAAKDIAHRIPQVYFTAGFHPHDAKDMSDASFLALKNLAQDEKCVAIGECGLDYYYEHSSPTVQKEAFAKQIELAQELKLPVVIHLRDAFDDCINILNNYKNLHGRVVIHCFSGTLLEAKVFWNMGFYISLSGIVTFKKPGDLLQVAKEIPLEQLLIETDAPYLSPHPFRGQRNEPALIRHTLAAIASARGGDALMLEETVYHNTKRFFGF